jgi:hypothetical protein
MRYQLGCSVSHQPHSVATTDLVEHTIFSVQGYPSQALSSQSTHHEMTARTLYQKIATRSASTAAQIETSRPHIAPIPGRSILQISGKDAQKFLKGLTSRDVDKSPGWGYSGFLTPTVSIKIS